jgi:hypothetical protein
MARAVHEIAKRGGRVESVYDDEIVVSAGKINHPLHFILGLLTLGIWWVVVWLPICLFGGRKRRVVKVGAPTARVRLPHELPALPTILGSVALLVLLAALHVSGVLIFLAVLAGAVLIRALANARS